MHLAFHGGKCCGIKTIYGFCCDPYDKCTALPEVPVCNADFYGHHVSSDKRFFHEAAPVETSLERLDRYIAYCDKRRPNGIIEVTLATVRYDDRTQVDIWGPILKERGFFLMNSCYNSNSGNRVYVYHRNTDK